MIGSCLLTSVLANPERVKVLALDEWDLLVRQARFASLLPRVAWLMDSLSYGDYVPEVVRPHLVAAKRLADKQASVVRYEISCIYDALGGLNIPIVLLKGAAYVAADLPAHHGRVFSDVDFLVPRESLEDVERLMVRNGWIVTMLDEYDQHYFRIWCHELPPMKHGERQTVVDIHHTILPLTAKLKPNAKKLLTGAQPLENDPRFHVLSPVDMVLHSATHLFHEGELEHGLRDLVDLDALLRYFGREEDFWDKLVERAADMDLGRPLYYALHFTSKVLKTPIPSVAYKGAITLGHPLRCMTRFMDQLYLRAFMPDHSSCNTFLTPIARWLLFVRAHHLRMPWHVLVPHLIRKAFKKRAKTESLGGAVKKH